MRLKARESELNSSLSPPTGTRAERSPLRTRSAAATSKLIGRAMRVREAQPDPHRARQQQHADAEEQHRERDLVVRALALELLILLHQQGN